MTRIELFTNHTATTDAISIEQYRMRRIQRRRRVAKRMLKSAPLFAVEMMQEEFPGYSLDEFIGDVTRKTRKGKSFRHIKTRRWDWKTIRQEIPDFFQKCKKRKPTSATLHLRLKDRDYTVLVRQSWYGEFGDSSLNTFGLIRIWKGSIKDFLNHPSILVIENNNDFK